MTNKEKAREITNEYCYWDDRDESGAVKVAIEMAEWKDQQLKEYLEKKKAEMKEKHDSYHSVMIRKYCWGNIDNRRNNRRPF